MSAENNLTTAEKRKIAAEKRKATIAARAAQEAEANIAFQNESEANGGRKAKKAAKKNAGNLEPRPERRLDSGGLIPGSQENLVDPDNDDADFIDVDLQPRSRKSSASSHMSAISAVRRMHVDSDVDSRGHRSRSSSMGSSVPPTEFESDGLVDVDAEEAPKKKKKKAKKSKKVSEARQRQAAAEQPVVRSEAANTLSQTATAVNTAPAATAAVVTTATATVGPQGVVPAGGWHISTIIVLPAPGKDISLTAQHIVLQQVLRGTILIIKIELLFDDAYPRMTSRAGYARERMTQAAIPIPDAIHILRRLGVDPVFGAQLSSIPIDRTNILRGNFKRTAVTCVKARVEELLKDHRYIFPAIEGRLRLDQPFAQGAIAFIIKEEVFSSPLFVTQNLDRFPARSSKHPMQRGLDGCPRGHGALVEHRNTGRRQNIAFSEDAYESTYRNHMDTLSLTRKSAPNSMHRILHQLFNDVTEADQVAHTTSGSSATLIQLIDVPDSD
ncbi:hypothetical protein R3P38DRAFT_3179809 [Favolaschia claudopus]|uniref:DUF6532 domain-containing protein n=1 Tax=Favolaschia claudopus TaxID=2862362 RepID=A0AAW0CT93_9AGAR